MNSFSDPAVAAAIRDTIAEVARDEIDKTRPKEAYGTVASVDVATQKVLVTYPGETSTVPVSFRTVAPVSSGAVVRIAGAPGDRYVQDVMTGAVVLYTTDFYMRRAGAVAARITQEGGSGLNTWILEPNGNNYTITSSDGKSFVLGGTNGDFTMAQDGKIQSHASTNWLRTSPRVKIENTIDPGSLTSTTHAFDIGGTTDNSGSHLKIGPTTIQATFNTIANPLNLNPLGGNVLVNGHVISGAALGRLNFSTLSSNSASFTGTVVYPLSVTHTLAANRKIRVRVHTNVQSATAATGFVIGIANGAGTVLNQAYRLVTNSNTAEQISCELETTSGAGGSTTFQLSAFTSGASGFLVANATAMTYISIYDEGAS